MFFSPSIHAFYFLELFSLQLFYNFLFLSLSLLFLNLSLAPQFRGTFAKVTRMSLVNRRNQQRNKNRGKKKTDLRIFLFEDRERRETGDERGGLCDDRRVQGLKRTAAADIHQIDPEYIARLFVQRPHLRCDRQHLLPHSDKLGSCTHVSSLI